MKIEIVSQPLFNLYLPAETIELLLTMSRHHYDGVCKDASAPGGFIYGWKNSVAFMPEEPVSANWRQLDTMLKICENTEVLHDQPGARDIVRKLYRDARFAITLWTQSSENWRLTTEHGRAPNEITQ